MRLLLIALALSVASIVQASTPTWTPTNTLTATPTASPTVTPTFTPTASRAQIQGLSDLTSLAPDPRYLAFATPVPSAWLPLKMGAKYGITLGYHHQRC